MRNSNSPIFLLFTLLVIVGSVFLGRMSGRGSNLPLAIAGGLVLSVPLIRAPYIGLMLSWFFYFIVPYEMFRLPIPVFGSLLMLIASAALLSGLLRAFILKEPLPSSSMYKPIALWVGLWIVWLVAGYGTNMPTEFEWTIKGMWPLAVVIVTVRNPQQAGLVLLAFVGALLVMLIQQLPTSLIFQSVQLSDQLQVEQTRAFGSVHVPQMAALIWPLFFSITLASGVRAGIRIMAAGAAVLAFLLILSAGYAMPYVTLFTGFGAYAVYTFFQRRSLGGFVIYLALMLMIIFILLNTQGAVTQINRLLDPYADQSGNSRMHMIINNLEGFSKSPLFGWGNWYWAGNVPTGVYQAGNHHTVTDLAVKFGLLGIIPFFTMLGVIGWNILWLLRRDLQALDKAIVLGIFSAYVSYVAAGFVSVSMGHITWDTMFWFYTGLVLVWVDWIKHDRFPSLLPQ